jgi:Predicted enzyme with a TIM-barrel fold
VKHLVGPIQSNKANKAARLADVLHAVDSADIARRLAQEPRRTRGAASPSTSR